MAPLFCIVPMLPHDSRPRQDKVAPSRLVCSSPTRTLTRASLFAPPRPLAYRPCLNCRHPCSPLVDSPAHSASRPDKTPRDKLISDQVPLSLVLSASTAAPFRLASPGGNAQSAPHAPGSKARLPSPFHTFCLHHRQTKSPYR
jgi:hypothetical protein